MDIDVKTFCAGLFGLYFMYVWNNVSCEHSAGHRRCGLSNFEKSFVWRILGRRAGKGKLLHYGPMLTEEYDPSIGYEPYWADGDWVFLPPDSEAGDACGVQCPPAYREYGKICGVERDKWNQLKYKTFNTYCDMLNEDCTGKKPLGFVFRADKVILDSSIHYQPGVRITSCDGTYKAKSGCPYRISAYPFWKKAPFYNPNMGYEPYWTDGTWVFELPRDRNMSISTTKWPTVCGEECSYLYTRIGEVCARRSDDNTFVGCSGAMSYITGCDGSILDDYSGGYVTFKTYCGFLDAQCKSASYTKWVFVHVGKCIYGQDKYFKPMYFKKHLVSRLESYVSALSKVFQQLTITPFG